MNGVMTHVRRLPGWWLVVFAAAAIVAVIASQQIGVLLWKVLQVAAAIPAAYAADKTLFRDAPGIAEAPRDIYGGARILARALVAHAVITGLTRGL